MIFPLHNLNRLMERINIGIEEFSISETEHESIESVKSVITIRVKLLLFLHLLYILQKYHINTILILKVSIHYS